MLVVITEVKLETHVANCTSCDLFQLKRLIWLRIEKQEEPPRRIRTRSRLRCACCVKRTRITNRAKRTSDHAADKCARKWWIGDGGRETERECEEWKKRTCVGGCQTEISQLNEVRTNIYAFPLSEWRRCCSAATTLEITERNNCKRWSRMLLCLCCCCCCQAHHTFAIFALVFFFLCLLLSFFLVLQCNKMHANQSKLRLVDSSQLCAWCCHII